MNKQDLLDLADFLETVPRERFNFMKWSSEDWDRTTHTCGTTACALGWAASMPQFRARGLRICEFTDMIGHTVPGVSLNGEQSPLRSAMTLFDISIIEAKHLFMPTGPWVVNGLSPEAGPHCLAGHIRRFVDAGGIP